MFEAVFALCAGLSEGPCRDQLLPGFEAETQAACEAALHSRPPDLEGDAAPICQALGPALTFTEIADGVFVHLGAVAAPDLVNRGDVSNIGFVVGQSGVAVIDTGSARWIGEGVWRAVREVTDLPITHVVLTHMHPDHVLGAAPLAEAGAQIVGHSNLQRALADRQANYVESLTRLIGLPAFLGTQVVAVDWAVETKAEIDLGGRTLALRAWPTAHSPTDVTVLDHGTDTLFTGDLVFHRHTPALDGMLRGWQTVLREMSDLDVARTVPGHGGPVLNWPDGAAAMERYLNVLARDTKAAIDAGTRLGEAVEQIAQDEAVHWELFEEYNPRNATVAFTELEWE